MTAAITIHSVDDLTGAISWSAPISQPGLPWQGGRLALETRTDLQPEEARGWGAPGKYWAVQYLPEVQASINRPLRALAALPWRLEDAEPPDWATPMDLLCWRRQQALCARVWHRITRDRKRLTRFIREVVLTPAIEGFYLGEVVCDEAVLDFEGFDARYWMPRLPQFRAPWTVRYWLTCHEEPQGVILDASGATDYSGPTGNPWAVIPWRKLVHIAAEQIGSNLEGVSWLRPVYNLIRILQQAWSTEALAVEVNGIGEMHIELPEGMATDSRDAAALRAHISGRKSGQAPGLITPAGTKVNILSPQTTVPDFTPLRQGLTQSIMLGLSSADQLIAVQGTGAFAAREEATADQRDSYDYLAQEYVAAALEQVMDRAIAANYPGDYVAGRVFAPRVAWGNVETRDPGEYIANVAIAVQAGLIDPAAAAPVIAELLDLPTANAQSEGGTVDAAGPTDDPGTGTFIGTAEAAARFGVRSSTIVSWAKRGAVLAKKFGGRWRVEVGSVEAMIEGAPVAGAPAAPPPAET